MRHLSKTTSKQQPVYLHCYPTRLGKAFLHHFEVLSGRACLAPAMPTSRRGSTSSAANPARTKCLLGKIWAEVFQALTCFATPTVMASACSAMSSNVLAFLIQRLVTAKDWPSSLDHSSCTCPINKPFASWCGKALQVHFKQTFRYQFPMC